MSVRLRTAGLLARSNVFMTFAWYAQVITLMVFVPFAIFSMQQPFKLDYVYAGLCILGAVYFIFRHPAV